jgi:hypothetical protein
MLSITVWCNAKFSQRQGARLYSQLGGKFLGWLDVEFPSRDPCKRIWYLQEQAAKLLGHPTRGHRDVLLWTNKFCLTLDGFAYCDAVSPACAERLDSIDASSRVEMLWNQDDSYARAEVRRAGIDLKVDGLVATIRQGYNFSPFLLYLENAGVTEWRFHARKHPCFFSDLSLLKRARKVRKVSLKHCTPSEWQACNVPELVIELPHMMLDCQILTSLDRLEKLSLLSVHTHIRALKSLPRLKVLVVLDEANQPKTFEGKELHQFLHT